jgi:hypothetical protein
MQSSTKRPSRPDIHKPLQAPLCSNVVMKILGLREAMFDATTSTLVEVKGKVKGWCGWRRN